MSMFDQKKPSSAAIAETMLKSKQAEETKATQSRKNAEDMRTHTDAVDHLYNHFMQLIARASNQGKFAIDKVTFPKDRFKTSVVEDVVAKLKTDGYKVEEGGNYSLQTITFVVTW